MHLNRRCNALGAAPAELGINLTLWERRRCRLRPHQHRRNGADCCNASCPVWTLRWVPPPPPPPPETEQLLIDVLATIGAARLPPHSHSDCFTLFLFSTNLRQDGKKLAEKQAPFFAFVFQRKISGVAARWKHLGPLFCISKRNSGFPSVSN